MINQQTVMKNGLEMCFCTLCEPNCSQVVVLKCTKRSQFLLQDDFHCFIYNGLSITGQLAEINLNLLSLIIKTSAQSVLVGPQ